MSYFTELFKYIDQALQVNDEDPPFLNMEENDFAVLAHMGLGTFIRNQFLHGQDNAITQFFKGVNIPEPDDQSEILLRCYYRYRHNLPENLEELVEKFHKHHSISPKDILGSSKLPLN